MLAFCVRQMNQNWRFERLLYFRNIYLGETFCSYVCLHNDSTETCTRVSLKCDLQTATQRIPLYPGPNEPPFTDNFLSGSSINHVFHHEVRSCYYFQDEHVAFSIGVSCR